MDVKRKRFLAVVAVISVLNGIGLVLVPGAVLTMYGIAPGPGAVLGFRLFGLALLEFGLINWFVKDSHDWIALRGLLLGGTVGQVIGVIVSLWATLAGVMNPTGWVAVATYVILLVGYAYFLAVGARQPAAG